MNPNENVDLALTAIRNHFGAGTIQRLGANEALAIETLSTGSLAIDVALGAGGLPKGRIVEIYGPESSGKTTFCLSVLAQAQRKGGGRCHHRCRARPRSRLGPSLRRERR